MHIPVLCSLNLLLMVIPECGCPLGDNHIRKANCTRLYLSVRVGIRRTPFRFANSLSSLCIHPKCHSEHPHDRIRMESLNIASKKAAIGRDSS